MTDRTDTPDLVVRGGTVVDATGSRRADVLVGRGGVVAVGEDLESRPEPPCSTPVGAWSPRAWSTSTPTCASPGARRPRPSSRAPGRPRSAGTPRWWPCPTPTRPSTRAESVRNVYALAEGALAQVAVAGAITVGPGRRASRPHGRAGRPRGAALHRRRRRRAVGRPHAPGPPVRHAGSAWRWASTARTRSLAGGGAMHEGDWSSRLGLPGHAGRGRGGDGGPRHRPGPGHRGAGPLPAPVDGRLAGPGPPGPGRGRPGDRRGRAPPLHPDRRVRGGLRPRLQGQPAAAARPATWPRSRRPWPTARPTPSPPTTPPTPPS